ncbi:hypothetical protein [Chryseomicrobium excrementi]|nr:hypothetical protein [Chryseomicrobium excrementi]
MSPSNLIEASCKRSASGLLEQQVELTTLFSLTVSVEQHDEEVSGVFI